jgi:hypothetical protein
MEELVQERVPLALQIRAGLFQKYYSYYDTYPQDYVNVISNYADMACKPFHPLQHVDALP